MNKKFLNLKILASIMLLLLTWNNRSSIKEQTRLLNLSWKKAGIHNIPSCHSSLTLSNNQLALIDKDIPEEIKKLMPSSFDFNIQALVLMPEGTSTGYALIAVMKYPAGLLDELEEKGKDYLLGAIPNSFMQGFSKSRRFQGRKVSYQLINDPEFVKASQTIFFTFEIKSDENTFIETHAWIFGKLFAIMVFYESSKNEHSLYKDQFRSLVSGIKLESEYSLPQKASDKITLEQFQILLLYYIIIATLLFIFGIIWRIYSKAKIQKIASELFLCFILATLIVPWTNFIYWTDFIYWPLYVVQFIPLIFFALFSWFWKSEYLENKFLCIIINTLFLIVITKIGIDILKVLADIFLTKHLSIEHSAELFVDTTIVAFYIWRYKKIIPSHRNMLNFSFSAIKKH